MIIPRQTVSDALYALLKSITFPALPTGQTTWAFTSTHWRSWADTSNQPAMYLVGPVNEDVSQDKRGLNRYDLQYMLWVYAQVNYNDLNADPMKQVCNPILDAIDTALAPDPATEYQNLGLPQVANARIKGKIEVCDGSIDGQAVISLDVHDYVGS